MARLCRLLMLVAALLAATSCQEGGEAGDLFGQWRLDGSDQHYLNFSGSLVLFCSLTDGNVYGTFSHEGDSLFIRAYSIEGVPQDTVCVEQIFGFTPFQDIRLRIATLSSERLLLTQGSRNWAFSKY